MKYAKVKVEFIFECPDNAELDKITKSVTGQIVTDLNEYYQSDDETAQMVELLLGKPAFIPYRVR